VSSARAIRGAWLVLLLVAGGCTSYRVKALRLSDEPGWPIDNPRIRLTSVIELHGRLARNAARVLNRLGGDQATFSFRRPYAVAWDGEDLLVTDPDAGRVARIDSRGRIHLSPEAALSHPVGVAVCESGIVVTDAAEGRVALLDHDLHRVRWLAENLSRPTGVACSGDRTFVVETGAHRVVVLRPGEEPRTFGGRGVEAGNFNFPTSIVIDGEALLIGDTLNFRIQRLAASTGASLGGFGQLGDSPGEMPRTKGLAIDSVGQVWVTDAHLDRVSLYAADGELLISLGSQGSGLAQFSFPAGVAAHPDGRVAVVDSLNRRLQVFQVVEPVAEGGGV
jgi:DNA-binding beta-propeller fold protein YncE